VNLNPQAFEKLGFETLAIHAGQDADPLTGAVVTDLPDLDVQARRGRRHPGRI
jgi:hypothetical protein